MQNLSAHSKPAALTFDMGAFSPGAPVVAGYTLVPLLAAVAIGFLLGAAVAMLAQRHRVFVAGALDPTEQVLPLPHCACRATTPTSKPSYENRNPGAGPQPVRHAELFARHDPR